MDAFWSSGPEVVDAFAAHLGLDIAPTAEIVEVGCGIGRLTRVLAERGASVRALDVSGDMLERAKGHNPDLRNV